jgi:hypothetical protein
MNERTGSSTNRSSAAGQHRAPREAQNREVAGLLARMAEEARHRRGRRERRDLATAKQRTKGGAR